MARSSSVRVLALSLCFLQSFYAQKSLAKPAEAGSHCISLRMLNPITISVGANADDIKINTLNHSCVSVKQLQHDALSHEYKIGKVTLLGIGGADKLIKSLNLIYINESYSSESLIKGLQLISDYLRTDEILNSRSSTVAAAFIAVDVDDISTNASDKQLEIVFKPYYINFAISSDGNRHIPYLRIITPSGSFDADGKIQKGASAIQGFSSDNYGPSISLSQRLPRENVSEVSSALTDSSTSLPLVINGSFRKSLSDAFYDFEGSLGYQFKPYDNSPYLSLSALYQNRLEPLGDARSWNAIGGVDLSASQIFDSKLIRMIGLGLNGHSEVNNLTNDHWVMSASSWGYTARLFSELRIFNGKAKAGIWYNQEYDKNQSATYTRAAVLGSYNTEIGSDHNTIGFTMLGGLGTTSKNTPSYLRFYGGTQPESFSEEEISSVNPQAFPSGPLLRSFGENQAFLGDAGNFSNGGGTRFWNVSTSIAVPIRALSKPLIPEIVVFSDTKQTAGDILKKQVNSKGTRKFFYNYLIEHGFSQANADAEVRKTFDRELIPVTNYLVDQANLYSIRPLLLVDVAGLGSASPDLQAVWTGVGGGLQFSLVNAVVEFGYLQTVAPSKDASRGNFFARFRFGELDFF
jgi:hypothetical protein